MSEQLSLLGIDPPEPPRDRIFFALKPAAEVVPAIDALDHELQRRYGWPDKGKVAAKRLHITLHHLGDHAGVPQDLVARAKTVAQSVKAEPFDVAFDRVMTFTRSKKPVPTVLASSQDNQPLVAFQKHLGDRLRAAGMAHCVDVRFTPHVTLHYADRPVTEEAVPALSWAVTEFVLIHSLLGRSEHRILGAWAL